MKNVTTGLGLCVLGVGIAAYPVLDHLVPRADAGAPRGGGAIVAAATGQVEPTIVWYGMAGVGQYNLPLFARAWSNGRIEGMAGQFYSPSGGCTSAWDSTSCGWVVISDPAQGLTYRSDINFDSKIDGADLGTLLADWGNAPRRDVPPSDCPLNMINP